MSDLQVISKKIVFSHPWESIELQSVRTKSGSTHEYLISITNPYVIILVENERSEFLLLRQYKHGARKILVGFPAGYTKSGENRLDAAKRELYEETGYKATSWHLLGDIYENPTRSPTQFTVFHAKQLSALSTINNVDILEGNIKKKWVHKDHIAKILPRMGAAMICAYSLLLNNSLAQ